MIKTIIFDCSDTLLRFGAIDMLEQMAGDRARAMRIHRTLFTCDTWGEYDNGRIPEEQLAELLLPLLEEEDREIGARYLKEYIHAFSVIEGIPELLTELKEKGYKLYLLSDFPASFERVRSQFDLFDLFDELVVSYKVGTSKKDGGLFGHLLKTYNLCAEECLFVDDILANVEKAEQHGIHVIQFTGVNVIREYLQL